MNASAGIVLHKETGLGIPNLVATLYNIDTTKIPPASLKVFAQEVLAGKISLGAHDRLGSAITDANGAFTLEYDEDLLKSDVSKKVLRPSLALIVSVPEAVGRKPHENILHVTDDIRSSAGKAETYLVRISTQSLVAFSLPVPEGEPAEETPENKVLAYKQGKQKEAIIREGVRTVHKETIDKQRIERQQFKNMFRENIVAKDASNQRVGYFVKENEPIEPKHQTAVVDGVKKANAAITASKEGVPFNLYLTKDDLTALAPFKKGDFYENVPENVITPILSKSDKFNGANAMLFSDNPILKYCREKTFEEKCAAEHVALTAGQANTGGNGNTTGQNVEVVNSGDIPKYVARLIGNMPAPETAFTGNDGTAERPDLKQVQAGVNNFRLEKGPADTTSFHDFHSLQIAFDHVWQQLLDYGVVRCAGKAHTALLNKGANLANATPGDVLAYMKDENAASDDPEVSFPDVNVLSYFDVSVYEWNDLTNDYRRELSRLATKIAATEKDLMNPSKVTVVTDHRSVTPVTRTQVGPDIYALENEIQRLKEKGERIIEFARDETYTSAHKILRELEERLRSNYAFSVFAADKNYRSVNFGLLNTFRQKWEPVAYQVGQLVKTMPLSPKEERKYSLKVTINKKRVEKESVKNNRSSQTEQTSTARAEAEIMEKAMRKTNFSIDATGTFNLGIYEGDATTKFGLESQEDSQQTRKDFREAVLKAVQEYKEERSTEIDTEESYGSEYTESGTIVNPNDELAVTYLFYELQRRYRVSEQLHRVAPVVLVAQEVPNPDDINEAWVVAHDWILNRFLLDDSFRPALQYVSAKNVGDDYSVRELRKNLRHQRQLVETLRLELTLHRREADNRYSALEKAVNNRIREEHREHETGFFWDMYQTLYGSPLGPLGNEDPETAQAFELAAKDAHRVAMDRAEKTAGALQQEMSSLHQLTADYNRAMRDHLDKKAMVKRLLVHLKNNILYYMQAIWSMEPPDQRYFRLYNVKVPQLESAGKTYKIEAKPVKDIFEAFRPAGTTRHKASVKTTLKGATGTAAIAFKPLVEVADLDKPLGFKGNYMIFPLKQHNALTEMMATPFIDAAFGAMDPDQLSNINLDEYARYVCCLHDNLPAAEYEKLKPALKEWLKELLADPLRNGDEIIVPSGSLYIEVLASGHNLLEGFKQRHRVLDVQKVQAEVRALELENIRYAARLLSDEREDPRIEKKIVVEGNGVNVNMDNA